MLDVSALYEAGGEIRRREHHVHIGGSNGARSVSQTGAPDIIASISTSDARLNGAPIPSSPPTPTPLAVASFRNPRRTP